MFELSDVELIDVGCIYIIFYFAHSTEFMDLYTSIRKNKEFDWDQNDLSFVEPIIGPAARIEREPSLLLAWELRDSGDWKV